MSYAGDLSPQEAWAKLGAGAVLVDVRTEAEWQQIGVPVTAGTGRDPLLIEWNLAGGVPNPRFLDQLTAAVAGDGTELLFLCRSGARSAAAAAAATTAGFTAYNVLEGFEGEPGPSGARDVNGWKNRGLPTDQDSTA
ncbi:rhodanese-like domain-containing protein [Arthrobacter sp. Soil763]|uniref:rhodanese-like domain-containing protein n=1 Tax=Arthrobacter sp. Soil763 TaxID=1736402 RepID=UPI0006FA0A19|nr:rhodanese-like domain-containing protein [Arthrobacter sp. Soil763]KRE79233.1 sulfurtransferase [Arthrobacter sp. Soil763]